MGFCCFVFCVGFLYDMVFEGVFKASIETERLDNFINSLMLDIL